MSSEQANAQHSRHIYLPQNGRLKGDDTLSTVETTVAAEVDRQLRQHIFADSYPCVAAVQAMTRNDYAVGLYRTLGRGDCWRELRADLLVYLRAQQHSNSLYSTMFAIFPETPALSEEAFEAAMWAELSMLTSEEQKQSDWAPHTSSDPADPGFVMSLGGNRLFVVGLHPGSSRRGRRFPFTGLVFNAFDQFEQLERKGSYERMVALNRKREVDFDGGPNPMVALHGDKWESIQFSGRNNPSDWQCPFKFMHEREKK